MREISLVLSTSTHTGMMIASFSHANTWHHFFLLLRLNPFHRAIVVVSLSARDGRGRKKALVMISIDEETRDVQLVFTRRHRRGEIPFSLSLSLPSFIDDEMRSSLYYFSSSRTNVDVFPQRSSSSFWSMTSDCFISFTTPSTRWWCVSLFV